MMPLELRHELGELNFRQYPSEELNRTLFRANDIAIRSGQRQIDTLHLLFVLVTTKGKDPVTEVLASLGIDLDDVRKTLELNLGKENKPVPVHNNGLTPEARRALKFAEEESFISGAIEITNMHLLLGLVREKEGLAGKVLAGRGVNLDNIRSQSNRVTQK